MIDRLVQWSTAREAPGYIVRGLRAVDPRADVLWWGLMTDVVDRPDPKRPWVMKPTHVTKPMWIVGTKSGPPLDPAAHRRLAFLESMKIPAKVEQQPAERAKWEKSWRDRRRLAWLKYQGFRSTFLWTAQDLDWSVVTELEAIGWFMRHLFEVVQRQAIKELEQERAPGLDLTERQRLIAEAVRLETPSIWKYAMKGRRSVLVPAHAA